MAYANLKRISCTGGKVEAFCRFRDFLCKRNGTYDYSATGIGWTLWDSYYTVDEDNPAINSYFIAYSPGENGTDDIYIQYKWTSGFIVAKMYQSWDPSTHAGSSNVAGGASNWNVSETLTSSQYLSVYGDLDMTIGITEETSILARGSMSGKVQPVYSVLTDLALTSTSALTAGSDVVINVGTVPAVWLVGMDVYVRTTHTDAMATVKIEKTRIKAVTSSTITVDLVNDYTADCKVSDHVGLVGANNAQIGYHNALIIPDGLKNQVIASTYNTAFTLAVYDPEGYSDFIMVYDSIFVDAVAGAIGYNSNFCRTPNHNATFAHLDLLVEPDGTSWRCFNVYSARYMAIREI